MMIYDHGENISQPTVEFIPFAFQEFEIGDSAFVDVDEPIDDLLPQSLSLYQNYPNPFNGQTDIVFDLPKRSDLTINIFNILGQTVFTESLSNLSSGQQVYHFNGMDQYGRELPSGIYYYQILTDYSRQSKKMLLVK